MKKSSKSLFGKLSFRAKSRNLPTFGMWKIPSGCAFRVNPPLSASWRIGRDDERTFQTGSKGQSLIEFILAIGVASIFLPALLVGLLSSREGKAQQNQRLEAATLQEEAQEAVRIVREKDWTTFAVNGTFHPVVSGNSWDLTSGSETINGFIRQVEISDVTREANGAIVLSGGTIDPSTKKAVITISWNSPFPSSVSSTTYFTRYLANLTFTQTTEADFSAGTTNDVVVTNTDGGEIVLGAGGQGKWCDPNLSITATNLPKQGVANGITAIGGLAFVGTGENASGESYAKVTISNENPPVASLEGTFSNYKTNGVFGEANYGYIATDTNAKEIVILDISQNPFTEVGVFDSPGSTDANSIFVSGDTGYMIAGNKLYNFDLTSKIGSRPVIDPDGVTLSGTGNKVVVVGSYAYVATDSSFNQLEIVNIINPSDLTVVGQGNVAGLSGQDVFVNETGTRAYLVAANSPTQNEFFIIDVSAKTGYQPTVGSYDSQGMNPKAVTVVPGNKAIIVGNQEEEYQVIDITNESNPMRCGGLQVDTGINGISSVLEADGDAFSYIITGDANSEFKIIAGGPGGHYTESGIFESSTFDPGFQVAYNRVEAETSQPPQTEIKYQIAVADEINGSCNGISFSYVGPDKTSDSYFISSGGTIPLSNDGIGFENPGRCFRYKTYFATAEKTLTPVFNSLIVNYSP